MWAPADTNALPTAGDLMNAQIAIEIVETQLNDALIALSQAQLRVRNIEKDLRERRAWIAPVRKLPLDVLSMIFEICGEDWKTTLRIAVVSRLWRDLALSTPRAWSSIDLKRCGDKEIVQAFFNRSGQHPLHIVLPEHESLAFLSNVVHRLQCLSVKTLDYDTDQVSFPRLTRLTIRETDRGIAPLSYIGIERFPVLHHLTCASELFRGPSPSAGIAPLHTLSLSITRRFPSLDLLKSCKDTLLSLKLCLFSEPTDPQASEIVLSRLKCLEIHFMETHPDRWPLTLVTPALETYKERSEILNAVPIHLDVGKVKFLHSDHALTLSKFPMLVVLQLEAGECLDVVLSQLTGEATLCPELTLIKVARFTWMNHLEDKVAELNKRRLSKQITIVPGPLSSLASIIAKYPCGKGMPCSN